MPTTVMWFEILSYLTLLLTLVSAALSYPELSGTLGEAATFGLAAIWIAFSIFLISSAARRRKNWARWFLLILYVGGLPFAVPSLAEALKQGGATAIIDIVNLFGDGAATYLVFSPSARPWFAMPRSKRQSRVARLFAETGTPYGEGYYWREYIPAAISVIVFFSIIGLSQLLPAPFSAQLWSRDGISTALSIAGVLAAGTYSALDNILKKSWNRQLMAANEASEITPQPPSRL